MGYRLPRTWALPEALLYSPRDEKVNTAKVIYLLADLYWEEKDGREQSKPEVGVSQPLSHVLLVGIPS